MAVYDNKQDEDVKSKFDDLMRHNVKPGEEDQMEAAAHHGAKEDLAGREAQAAGGTAKGNKKARSADQLAADEQSAGGGGGLYKASSKKGVAKVKAKIFNRRRVGAGLAGGGGIMAIVLSAFVFFQPFKIPSVMGDFEHDMGSSRMTRRIVERRFERVLVKYMVGKAMVGHVTGAARPGSALDKLYKMFDTIDMEGIIKKNNNIEFVRDNDLVRVLYKGKTVGKISAHTAESFEDYEKLKKANRAFSRDSKRIVTKTFPIFRLGTLSGTLRVWIKYMGFLRAFAPPTYDKSKTKAQNIADEITKPSLTQSIEPAVEKLTDAVDCLGDKEGACDALKRTSDPIDTTDPAARTGLGSSVRSGDSDNTAAKEIEKETGEAITEGVEKTPDGTRLMDGVLEKILTRILGETAGKAVTTSLPVIGWIDVLAQLQHAADVVNDGQLFQKTIVMLREHQAASVAATWLGYADNIKDGQMNAAFIAALNPRLSDHSDAEMIRTMYGMKGQGVPVDTKIGSTSDMLLKYDLAYQVLGMKTNDIYAYYNCTTYKIWNTVPCIIHGALWLWYNTISKITGALGNAVGGFFITVLKSTLPQYWAFTQGMKYLYGDDWEGKFAQFAAKAVLRMFGYFGFDPTASGPKLVNTIGIGTDVIFNRYMETNLGARDVTTDPGAAVVFLENDENYREDVASLPLNERLFSTDLPSSLVSRLAAATPSSLEPSSLLGSITSPLRALPGMLFSIFSGKSLALATQSQISAVDGVAQFGGNEDEVEADIPSEVTDQVVTNVKDVQCPNNAEGLFNNCQSYKEVIQGAMCYDTKNPCPQYQQ